MFYVPVEKYSEIWLRRGHNEPSAGCNLLSHWHLQSYLLFIIVSAYFLFPLLRKRGMGYKRFAEGSKWKKKEWLKEREKGIGTRTKNRHINILNDYQIFGEEGSKKYFVVSVKNFTSSEHDDIPSTQFQWIE